MLAERPARSASAFRCLELRVLLRGVSALIGRRLSVRIDSTSGTIADLYATPQTALRWTDEHLNRFVINAREYGVSQFLRIGFHDDPDRCGWPTLGSVGTSDSCTSTTSPTAGSMGCASSRSCRSSRYGYTLCVGGRRAVAPYECGGPWASLEGVPRAMRPGAIRRPGAGGKSAWTPLW